MWILPLVGYIGVILGFSFLTLAIGTYLSLGCIHNCNILTSIASGLYYLSELVEEHTVFTKYLLQRLIYFVIALQTLLCLVDSFPVKLSLLSIFSHVIYAQNLRRFPVVKLTDPLFILSCGMFEGYEWIIQRIAADCNSARPREPLLMVHPFPSPSAISSRFLV